jgi:HPt (histidine-containing phosphotransfer) domain-containing protein
VNVAGLIDMVQSHAEQGSEVVEEPKADQPTSDEEESNCNDADGTGNPSHTDTPTVQPILDVDAALSRLNNDRSLFCDLAENFVEFCPELLDGVQSTLHGNDPAAVRSTAHSLKGALADFTARTPFEAAQRIEDKASRGDLISARSELTALEDGIERLLQEIHAFIAADTTSKG